jgi:hypothetical protein
MKTPLRKIMLVLAAVISLGAAVLPATAASAQQHEFGTVEQNWGGYTLTFNNPDPQNDPLGASAIWTVPSISCTENGTPITNTIAEWVGLGGTSGQNLEQTGTAEQCTNGTPRYWPWYEFTGCTTKSQCVAATPNPVDLSKKSTLVPTPFHIYKGDNMAADVVEQGPGYFVTQLWDHGSTTHPSNTWYTDWIYQDSSSLSTPPLAADWILEDQNVYPSGGQPLPKYRPAVLFQNCYWNQDNATNELGSGATSAVQIYTNNTHVARTSAIGADHSSFSVTWLTYGV